LVEHPFQPPGARNTWIKLGACPRSEHVDAGLAAGLGREDALGCPRHGPVDQVQVEVFRLGACSGGGRHRTSKQSAHAESRRGE